MRFLTIILTLLFLSCATHRRTVSTATTATTAKTVVEATTTTTAASTITENRDTEKQDTATLHLHTATWTARDTVHHTDTIHRDIYLTRTQYLRLRNDYGRHATDTAAAITRTDTVIRTDTVTRTIQPAPTTRSTFHRLFTVLIVCLIAAIAGYLGNYIATKPKK